MVSNQHNLISIISFIFIVCSLIFTIKKFHFHIFFPDQSLDFLTLELIQRTWMALDSSDVSNSGCPFLTNSKFFPSATSAIFNFPATISLNLNMFCPMMDTSGISSNFLWFIKTNATCFPDKREKKYFHALINFLVMQFISNFDTSFYSWVPLKSKRRGL